MDPNCLDSDIGNSHVSTSHQQLHKATYVRKRKRYPFSINRALVLFENTLCCLPFLAKSFLLQNVTKLQFPSQHFNESRTAACSDNFLMKSLDCLQNVCRILMACYVSTNMSTKGTNSRFLSLEHFSN